MTVRIKFVKKYRCDPIECRRSEMKQILRRTIVVHLTKDAVAYPSCMMPEFIKFTDEVNPLIYYVEQNTFTSTGIRMT